MIIPWIRHIKNIAIFLPILSETTPQIILPSPFKIAYVAMAVPAIALAHVLVLPWNEFYTEEHVHYIAENIREVAKMLSK